MGQSMHKFIYMDVECRRLLTSFLLKFAKGPAWWYPVLPDVQNNLASFLGLDFHLRYIPLLYKCQLVKEKVSKTGEKSYTLCLTTSKARAYCWASFFAEHNLHDYELTHCYIKQYNKLMHFLCIGVFNKEPFTPIEQFRLNLPVPGQKWIRPKHCISHRNWHPYYR